MASIIGGIIAIVTAVIGFVIVDDVISVQSWNSTLSGTIVGFIVPVGLLSVMGMVAYAYS